MTVAELIKALSAYPPETRVILPDAVDAGDAEGFGTYADLEKVVTRHISAFELEHMQWDFSPAVEPWPASSPVVLLQSYVFERTEHHAPTEWAGVSTFRPVTQSE